jgi:hypothetical protein
MNTLSKALVEARVADLHRDAQKSRHRAAARNAGTATVRPRAVTLRLGTPGDLPALKRLAELDSSELPASPTMLAEVGGELRATLSLSDGTVIADPFQRTAPLVQLLLKWADQVIGDRSPRISRLREAVRTRARRRHRGLLVQVR